MALKCSVCGKEGIPEKADYCPECGSKLKKANQCCLCTKIMPFFAAEYSLSSELPKKKICDDCDRLLKRLQNWETQESIDQYPSRKEQILEYCNKTKDKEVVEFCKNIIDELDSKWNILTDLEKKQKNHLLTTGFNFEGYRITKYNGIVNGAVVLGAEADLFSETLNQAMESASKKLIQASVQKGGNAAIGVDFDYITFYNNIIGVIANGTSVTVERIETDL